MSEATTSVVRLRSGTLTVRVESCDMPLHDLCGFADRRSRKRGFVFVSKVLGKHWPVRPRLMSEVHSRLAAMLDGLPGPVFVVGMAETATGLGWGVHEQMLARAGRGDVLFAHTTRYRLSRPAAIHFEESHSHAVDHLLYEPLDEQLRGIFVAASSLVLVDDEISTGRTLANLAIAYRGLNPGLREVHLVCITDWLGRDKRDEIESRIGLPVHFHSLLRGSFTFIDDPAFDPGPIPDVVGRGDDKSPWLSADDGRYGTRSRLDPDFSRATETLRLSPGDRVLVLGTGEFSHPPYRLALHLECLGWDVRYQSVTRSPLLVGSDLTSVIETEDNYHDGIPNYLYNVADRFYDRIAICYETRPLPSGHQLPEILGAEPIHF